MDLLNLDDFSEIPQSVIDAENAREHQTAKQEAEQKIHTVMAFIQANPGCSTRKIVERFGLDWSLNKDFGNGIGKIGYYTDESQRFLVMELHDSIAKWFR